MSKQKHRYFMPAQIFAMLSKRDKCFCVSCLEPIMEGEEVTSRRSGNNLRLRCMPCSERLCLV